MRRSVLRAALALVLATPSLALERTKARSGLPDALPAAVFPAERAFASGRSGAALSILRDALRADPDDAWLHSTYIGMLSHPDVADAGLEAEYRAFAAARPSPRRELLLAMAITAAHRHEIQPAGPWPEEVAALLEGVAEPAELGPWPAIAAAWLALGLDDRSGYRREVERAVAAHPRHLALASHRARVARLSGDERAVVRVALEVAAAEPRLLPRILEGAPAPLDRQAEPMLRKLVKSLETAVRRGPEDVELLVALYRAVALTEDGERLARIHARIRRFDPEWVPERGPGRKRTLGAEEADLVRRRGPARSSDATPRASVAEAAAGAAAGRFGVARATLARLGFHHRRAGDPAQAAEAFRRALAAGESSPWVKVAFVASAAESRTNLEQAAAVADEVVAAELDQLRRDPDPARLDAEEQRAKRLAAAYEARGLIRRATAGPATARRDLVLATAVDPDGSGHWARLAQLEEELGQREGAYAAWLRAVALGAREEEDGPAWRKRLDALAGERYLWATPDDLIAAERARLGRRRGLKLEPGGRPPVGSPAPPVPAPVSARGAARPRRGAAPR